MVACEEEETLHYRGSVTSRSRIRRKDSVFDPFLARYPKDIFTSSNSAPSQQQQEQEQMFACAFDGMRVKWKDWELLKSNRARISDVLSKTSTEDIFVDKEEEHLAHMDID